MEQGDKFSEDFQENLRIENEFLRIKLKAQYGDAFHMETTASLTPEIENQFLKNMMAFEEAYLNEERTTIYKRIGCPVFKPLQQYSKPELNAAIRQLILLLRNNDINFTISDGPYPDEKIYRFITEELFIKEIEKKGVPGLTTNFTYEEFYPNHKAEILKRTHSFLDHWFHRSFNEFATEISWRCTSSEGIRYSREDITDRMNIFFEAFATFKNDGYNINDVNFELVNNEQAGLGHTEGMLKYDAVMENGEIIHYGGPYRLYLQLEDGWWSIYYFMMPGFRW